MSWDLVRGWMMVVVWVFFLLDAVFVAMLAIQKNMGDDAAGRGMALGFAMMLAPVVAVAGCLLAWGQYSHNVYAFAAGALIVTGPLQYKIYQQAQALVKTGQRAAYWARVGMYKSGLERKLSAAIALGDTAAMRQLLVGAPKLTGEDPFGNTLLWEALMFAKQDNGSIEPMRVLLEAGVHPDEVQSPRGFGMLNELSIPLEYQNCEREKAAVKLLLKHGANPNRMDSGSGLPIIFSAYLHPDLMMVLKQYKADLDIKTGSDVTPLLDWAWNEKWSAAVWLVENGAKLDGVTDFGRTLDECMSEAVRRVDGDESKLPPEYHALREAIRKRRQSAPKGRLGPGGKSE